MSEGDNKQIVNTTETQINNMELLGDIDFRRFLLILTKSLIWIVLLLLIAFAGSYIYLRYTIPIYESSSVLKLEIKSDVDALGISKLQNPTVSNNLSGEVELIKSELIHDQVIDQLDALKVSYMTEGTIKDDERFMTSFFEVQYNYLHPDLLDQKIEVKIIDEKNLRIYYKLFGDNYSEQLIFNKAFKNDHLEILITKKSDDLSDINQNQFYFIVNSHRSLVDMIKSNLFVQILNPSANTLKIIYRDPNPLKAKTIVDYINKVYLENTLELKNQASKQTIDFLNDQLNKTEDKLTQSEKELEAFVEENKTTDIDNIFTKRIEKIEKYREELRAENEKLIILKNLEKAFEAGDTLYYQQITSAYPGFQAYDDKMNQLMKNKNQLEVLKYSTNSNTLAFQYAQKDIKIQEKALENALENDRKITSKEVAELRKAIAELEGEIKALPEKETEYKRLKRIYDLNEKFYLLLMDKKAEFGISEAGTIPDFQVLSPANFPKVPVFPKESDVYLISFGAALLLILLLIGVRYVSHNTIDSVEEIEKYLNIPMLGVVPLQKIKSKYSRLVVTDNPKSEIAEAIRSIRTNLDFITPGNNGKKTISVTSTVSSEGKTFVSVNLGAVIAMSNQKVILLDLDMRKPKLHIALNEENHFGMSNLLIGKMELDEAIRHTSQENLDYISSGPPPPNPSELILLPQLDEIISKLKEKYDIIIMDSPPIGLVTDGIILMKKVDIPVYILRSEYSKKGFLKSIQKLQKQKGIDHLSIIFNGLKRRRGLGGYGYNYGYGYGYGSGYYGESNTKKKFLGIF
ncbi:MAG: polysaccharide biosynthesis tyrosine autokinase [Cytophagales bacterium]